MQQHLSAYNTGIANTVGTNLADVGVGWGMTAAGAGIAGFTSFNPLLMLGGMAGMLKGWASMGAGLNSQLASKRDMQRQTLQAKNKSSIEMVINRLTNPSVLVSTFSLPDEVMKSVAYHYHRYGYLLDQFKNFKTTADFCVKANFNFWKISNMVEVINNAEIPQDCVDEMAKAFADGITI